MAENQENTENKEKVNYIAQNLSKMKKEKSYKTFDKGYFNTAPKMEGYIMKLEGPTNPSYLVVNTAKDFTYKREFVKTDGNNLIIYNYESLPSFIDSLTENSSDIIKYLKEIFKDDANVDLPKGYFRDENGEIKVNVEEAQQVKKIFKEYTTARSIRKVANANKLDYSYVRDILHDDRYEQMPIKIIPDLDLKKVYQILQANRKNIYQKQSLKQSLKSNALLKKKFSGKADKQQKAGTMGNPKTTLGPA